MGGRHDALLLLSLGLSQNSTWSGTSFPPAQGRGCHGECVGSQPGGGRQRLCRILGQQAGALAWIPSSAVLTGTTTLASLSLGFCYRATLWGVVSFVRSVRSLVSVPLFVARLSGWAPHSKDSRITLVLITRHVSPFLLDLKPVQPLVTWFPEPLLDSISLLSSCCSSRPSGPLPAP